MSFFYLTPVKGDLPIHLLEIIVTNRLQYLEDIIKGNNVGYNEFVVEGSIYDNIGHFMLCITAILNKNLDFIQFLLKTEVQLFKRRIASITAYDMRIIAKRLIRCIKKYDKYPSFIDPLLVLCQHLKLKDIAQHICSTTHPMDCSNHYLQLNFQYCLQFVAKRQVELRDGIAYLPCGKWKQYLIILFSMNLKYRINNTNLDPLNGDPRIQDLLHKVKGYARTENDSNFNILTSKIVDNMSELFPPCMLNLHRNLRKNHRLSHLQRFYYTLFLKDIGMPVEEAINFWRSEYQSPSGTAVCCHTWEKDEKKFIYGIRHMYGLEGGRKGYSSYSCQYIQNMDTSCHEGGCPFQCFDTDKMIKLLNVDQNKSLLSQINELRNGRQYSSACILYLKYKHNLVCDNITSSNFTPVKYYINSRKNSIS